MYLRTGVRKYRKKQLLLILGLCIYSVQTYFDGNDKKCITKLETSFSFL